MALFRKQMAPYRAPGFEFLHLRPQDKDCRWTDIRAIQRGPANNVSPSLGGLAERLCTGLQIQLYRFDSGIRLHISSSTFTYHAGVA
jgi:hypothetical protein